MSSINPENSAAQEAALAALALQIAQGQVGQSEQPTGSNSGPMVNEYLKTVGLNPGYAWCQAFVYWCYNEAAKKMGIPNPLVKTAGVYDCWNRTTAKQSPAGNIVKLLKADVIRQSALLKPGDQFILTFGRTAGHTGIIEKIEMSQGSISIHTIEGNSNSDGSREGYEVVRHVRSTNEKALQGFIQYA